jgi:hypothetical protein
VVCQSFFFKQWVCERSALWFIDNNSMASKNLSEKIFFSNADTHTCMSTHPYKHTHVHSAPMSTSERLSRLDLEIHEVGHQECLAVNEDVASH